MNFNFFGLQSIAMFLANLHPAMRDRLNLPTYANAAAFVLAVGHAPNETDRYYNSTLGKVVVFVGGVWRVQGGPVLDDQG